MSREVKTITLLGAYAWHQNPNADDFFGVISGQLRIETENGNLHLGPGQTHTVPRGRIYRVIADTKVRVSVSAPQGRPISEVTRTANGQ